MRPLWAGLARGRRERVSGGWPGAAFGNSTVGGPGWQVPSVHLPSWSSRVLGKEGATAGGVSPFPLTVWESWHTGLGDPSWNFPQEPCVGRPALAPLSKRTSGSPVSVAACSELCGQ